MNPEPNEKIVWHFGINFVVACLLFVALVVDREIFRVGARD